MAIVQITQKYIIVPCIPLSLRINYDSTRKAISIVAILRLSRLVTCKAFWLEEP